MTYPEGFNFMPGAVHLSGATDPDVRAENECRQIGPIHYCPGQSIGLGHAGDGPHNDTGVGLVFVPARGGGGRPFRSDDTKVDAQFCRSAVQNGRHDRRERGRPGCCSTRPRDGSR